MSTLPNRRQFLRTGLSTLALGALSSRAQDGAVPSFPPARVITKGPGFHWFGYYDKFQFDPTNRFVLSNKVSFEHRSPTGDDVIEVGMVDLEENDKWIPLGKSRAWNWQQGCMLQWIPGTESKIIWNDREKDRYVSHILDVKTGDKQTLPSPIYSVSPNGREAVSCDFARVADCRPGYGYAGLSDRYFDDMAPEGSGVTHVDLETGAEKLIVTHKQLAATGEVMQNTPTSKHHAYHLLVGPDGKRFIMLHRWTQPKGGHLTRLITAAMDGSDLRIIIPNGFASHFIWRDATHILSQAKGWLGNDKPGNFLFEDRDSGIVAEIGKDVLDSGGHFSYLHNNEWILNDTYPKGVRRIQTPHLYHIKSNRRMDLGHFPSPRDYTGEWRVDSHPRSSRDERWVCIDSPHGDQGRQLHLIDIQGLMS
ncbi:hypothetical protein WJU23_02665 [Prosthecobacter sp. SYSU 5D2]|uniref:hypothetical protein n=1 Tax=Prosthecobacter sp. SYSU 5D2 TaxID=3134134 RepID=UPI0031FF0032